MPLDPSIPGHLPNVRLLARACDLAYLDEPEASAAYQSELGMSARLISVDNTQAYLAGDDGSLVVAFRGSQCPTDLDGCKDWLLTNANNLLIIPEGRIGTDFASAGVGARFHRGFMEALAEIWDPLVTAVQQAWDQSERPLWVTGHSLGGAIALLAAWRFQRQFIPVHEIVTFGAPIAVGAYDPDSRKDALDLAHLTRDTIGRLYKVLPTAMVASAMRPSIARADLESRIAAALDHLNATGANLLVRDVKHVVEDGVSRLEHRGVIQTSADRFRVRDRNVLRYYARSIQHLLPASSSR